MNSATPTMPATSLENAVSAEEWRLRCDLAACYRLVALYGWSDLVFTHLTAKLPESVSGAGAHHFLINPYGLMFDEITASSLVKVDAQCNKIIDSPYPVNPAGFVIHSAVHAARLDAACVLHTHTRAGVAVSAQAGGLLATGKTIADAFLGMYNFENACRIQIDAQAGGGELTQVDPRILKGVAEAMRVQTGGMGGAFVWPALLRKLDRQGADYRS